MKFKELEYKDFLELVNFIEDHFKNQNDAKTKTLVVLRKFIPVLNGFQLILLMNFLEEKTEEKFNNLINNAGDVLFDPTGKSEPTESDFNAMNLEMIESMANNPIRENSKTSIKRRYREVLVAKTLKPLIDIKVSGLYNQKKKLYLRKAANIIDGDELNKLENNLKDLNLKYTNILEKVLEYSLSRSEENARVFIEHFSIRVAACISDLKDPRSEEFYNNLKRISQ